MRYFWTINIFRLCPFRFVRLFCVCVQKNVRPFLSKVGGWLEIQVALHFQGNLTRCDSASQMWGCLTCDLLWGCFTTVRLLQYLQGFHTPYEAASLIMMLPHQFLHGFEATSPFVRLTHKCKATSHVRQPHLFWGCFPPTMVTFSIVRLYHNCKAASPIVRLF